MGKLTISMILWPFSIANYVSLPEGKNHPILVNVSGNHPIHLRIHHPNPWIHQLRWGKNGTSMGPGLQIRHVHGIRQAIGLEAVPRVLLFAYSIMDNVSSY